MDEITVERDDKCECGEESTRGLHGVKNMGIYSEYYCDFHYNKYFIVPQPKKKERRREITADTL